MDFLTPKDFKEILAYVITGLLAIIAYYVKRDKKALDDNTEEIKALNKELNKLNVSVIKLEVVLGLIVERTDQIPEMQKDLNMLGEKVRKMNKGEA